MHITSYPRVAAWLPKVMLILASFAGSAQAVEFDEKIRAPMNRGGAELKTQAESYAASFARLSTASPAEMVTNGALSQERFDLEWQLTRALEDKRPMEDLSALGLVKNENGFRIDYNAFPQWQPFPEKLASLMPTMSMDAAGPLLVARGFRDSDVVALRNYLETHDLDMETSSRTLPIAISFSRVVRKYDKIKRPVGKDLVFSFLYQRDKTGVEARRAWSEGLIRTLDDQRVRVLQSYLSEIQGVGYWSPSDAEAGVANLLATMRLPDYEQRATAEAAGGAP
ncbi:MAG TPA: hypothetical protein VEW08_09225 [Steroidobacteraceae bacterium]|nr:hypothetical protein [Steroidobacteraceae bacterium]